MTSYRRGEVVMVRFVFADEQGAKMRPGLILSSEAYHAGRREVILAAITSHPPRELAGDVEIEDWSGAGLRLPSTVTGILRTIKQEMIASRMGALAVGDAAAVEAQLRRNLDLS